MRAGWGPPNEEVGLGGPVWEPGCRLHRAAVSGLRVRQHGGGPVGRGAAWTASVGKGRPGDPMHLRDSERWQEDPAEGPSAPGCGLWSPSGSESPPSIYPHRRGNGTRKPSPPGQRLAPD